MLYSYMTNVYSSRKIELALRANINFMRLTSTLKQIYTDGTKIEAQAGSYTFVWGNSIKY